MANKEETALEEVKQSVLVAAKKLVEISPEYERVSWLLEDALLLLDGAEDECISIEKLLEQELEGDYVPLIAKNS